MDPHDCRGSTLALRNMRLLFASVLLLALFPAQAQVAPQLTLHDLQEADALGADLYSNSGATGLVLVVVRGDKVFIHGYGETAPGSHTAPTDNSVIRLCSLTKTFTTDLLTKLVTDGTLHLDDPLEQYAPPGAIVPRRDAPITLLGLATHTAGLEREIGTPPRRTPHFTYPDFETRWQWLASAELKYTPGTQAFYSNIGFDLLSDALANAAHAGYPKLLSSRILKPLHMWDTTYFPNAGQCERLMRGFDNEGPCTVTENTEGSSGLYSTAADVAKWLRYLVGPATLESPVQPEAAHAVYLLPSSLKEASGLSHAGRPSGIGLGWMHLGTNEDMSHLIEKTGGGAGFITYIAIHPASHTALFVATTNGGPHGWGPGFNLFTASNNAVLALAGLPPLPRKAKERAGSAGTLRAAQHQSSVKPLKRKKPVRVSRGKPANAEVSSR